MKVFSELEDQDDTFIFQYNAKRFERVADYFKKLEQDISEQITFKSKKKDKVERLKELCAKLIGQKNRMIIFIDEFDDFLTLEGSRKDFREVFANLLGFENKSIGPKIIGIANSPALFNLQGAEQTEERVFKKKLNSIPYEAYTANDITRCMQANFFGVVKEEKF